MSKQSIPAWVDESWDEYRTIIELWSEQSGLPADKQCAHVITHGISGRKKEWRYCLQMPAWARTTPKDPDYKNPADPKMEETIKQHTPI